MKEYFVSAFFPEVKPAHQAEQTCKVMATKASIAAYRGLAILERRDGIRGKHVSTVRLVVRIIRHVPASDRETEPISTER